MKGRMRWSQSELIDQIISGEKRGTVARLEWSTGYDDYHTAYHVGQHYTVFDADLQPRCEIRLTKIELVTWGAIPEWLWQADPAASGEKSLAAFVADHDDFFGNPDADFEFLAILFEHIQS